MDDTSLSAPDRRAYLAADKVESIVGPLRQEIAILREQAAKAESEAAAAERRVGESSAVSAVEEARAAAASMRATAQVEMEQALNLARAWATALVAEARRVRTGTRNAPDEPPPASSEASPLVPPDDAPLDPPADPLSWEEVLAPVVVEDPTGDTWRLRSDGTTQPRTFTSWFRVELFLPMITAVMVLVVVLALVG